MSYGGVRSGPSAGGSCGPAAVLWFCVGAAAGACSGWTRGSSAASAGASAGASAVPVRAVRQIHLLGQSFGDLKQDISCSETRATGTETLKTDPGSVFITQVFQVSYRPRKAQLIFRVLSAASHAHPEWWLLISK